MSELVTATVVETAQAPKVVSPEFMGRKVKSVYSGRPGCACGCRGKHTNHPATPDGNRQVSARGVSIILGKMAKFAEAGIKFDDGGSYVAHETDTRLYVVYFVD